MILIIGGSSQGKRRFAKETFTELLSGCSFADGESASWEAFQKAPCGYNLHLMIRRLLEAGKPSAWLTETLPQKLAGSMQILITDEIGYGIVPLDPFEREYRETTGRVCCELAALADEVWRVVAGLGKRIK